MKGFWCKQFMLLAATIILGFGLMGWLACHPDGMEEGLDSRCEIQAEGQIIDALPAQFLTNYLVQ